jgi:nucleoside-triphosphatase THEP1
MANYIEIVRNFKARGTIIPDTELENLIKTTNGELYRSLYLYDEGIKKHIESSGSISKYPGTVYPDSIILDFDGDNALDYINACVLTLEDFGISDGYNVYFSGTGFHVELNSSLFNFEPTPNLPDVVRNTINELFPDADNIFDKHRIYRCANTINNKSNLYKIPLYISEVQTLTLDQIKDLARRPRWDFEYNDVVIEPKLKSYVVYENVPGSPKPAKSNGVHKTDASGRFACIHNMYETKPEPGIRHNIMLRLTSHFKRQNYSQKMAFDMLKAWIGKDFEKEGRQEELSKMVTDVYSWEGVYTCQDPLMQEYCNNSCPFYKELDIHDYDRMDKELIRRYEGDLFGFDLRDIPEWRKLQQYIIEQNELISINGAPGMGKSALIQNIVIKARHLNNQGEMQPLNTLYFSFEMPSYQVHRRNLQIVSDSSKKHVNANYPRLREQYKNKLEHIKVHTEAIYANELPGIIELVRPQIIVLDHIGLMNSQYRDEYAKISEITQTLRQISIKYDVIIFMISQVSRENAKAQKLGLHSGKGSGSIENDSNKVLTFERASRTSNEAIIQSTKDREGQSLHNKFYYNNESLNVGVVQ